MTILKTINKTIKAKKYLNSLNIYFGQIKNNTILTREEEIELSEQYKKGNTDAKNKLIECNLKLVVEISKGFINKGIPINDLIQEGNIGLIKAVEKFDTKYNCKFSTYAVWWIKQGMSRAIENQSRNIRVPVHVQEKINKLQKVTKEFIEEENREPSISELSEKSGIKKNKIEYYIQVYKRCETVSFNEPVFIDLNRNNDIFIKDSLSAECDNSIIDKKELIKKIYSKINNITKSLSINNADRNKKIFMMRIGYEDKEIKDKETLEIVGKNHGITRERTRQITKRILDTINSDKKLKEMYNDIINR